MILGIGFLTSHLIGIRYLKTLRGLINKHPTTVYEFIATATLLGGPVLLMHYALFEEDRKADQTALRSNILLISGIVITIIQIIIVALLFYFKVINFDIPVTEEPPTAILYLLNFLN